MTGPRILVVDDENAIVLLCQRLLSRAGYSVTGSTDPHQALDELHGQTFDLLLVDIRMPDISGFDVIHSAHEIQPELAILAMTGFGTVETAIQALRRGVDGLILKPFEKQELIQAVEQALHDSQQKRDASRIEALRPLFSITETLLPETRTEYLLDLILDLVSKQLDCSSVGFYQVSNKKEKSLTLLAGRGKLPPDGVAGANGRVLAQSLVNEQPIWDSLEKAGDTREGNEMLKYGYSTMMCVSTSLSNVRSVIFVAREKGQPAFREVELETFLILARQATIAFENAHLYQELRTYVQRVEDSQQALVQAEKLAAAGRLTASIAHEINNPLQSVRNCLHLATRDDIPEDMRQKYFEMTNQELDRLMNTVQRMLDFYRPTAELKPVQVLDLIEHVLNLLSHQLQEHNVQVTTSWPARLPSIRAISNQIEQVFINLVLNAFDAMPEGGELLISISQKRKMIEILFQDTGPGVPENIRENIFEPFVTTKHGTGLGLSVSYDIVNAHGGSLELVEGNQPGACFRVLLPINQERE